MARSTLQNSRQRSYPIQEDVALQERIWRFERGAWILLSVLLAAALLGVFSRGPLSETTAKDPTDAIAVTYERFERSGAATSLVLRIRPPNGADTISLRLSPEFLEGFTLTEVQPQPMASSAGLTGIRQTFRSEGEAFLIHFGARPRKAGMVRSRIAIEDGPSVQFTQFVYP